MSEPVKPALTPEQWSERLAGNFGPDADNEYHGGIGAIDEDGYLLVSYDMGQGQTVPPDERHALAALALSGQPFGFTREDVEMLRRQVDDYGLIEELQPLADRIEALLPPDVA